MYGCVKLLLLPLISTPHTATIYRQRQVSRYGSKEPQQEKVKSVGAALAGVTQATLSAGIVGTFATVAVRSFTP